MRKFNLLLFALILSTVIFAQDYDSIQLKTVAKIWGETYLFHPSIIRSDRDVKWEKKFVEFLPKIKDPMTSEAFIETVNKDLLSVLNDPFTVLQSDKVIVNEQINYFKPTDLFDYFRITNKQLENISSIYKLDSLITDRTSKKPLVIDLRINAALSLDQHTNIMFNYFAAMLIKKEIPTSLKVTREHYGWDEDNDWWFYEQRWKVATDDKQEMANGKLLPLTGYSQELQQYLPEMDFSSFASIDRPIYFITNNSFLSYYNSLLMALKNNRPNTYILNENTGSIYAANSSLVRYSFNGFEFILNTAFYINQGFPELSIDFNSDNIKLAQLVDFVNSKHPSESKFKNFTFEIMSKKYVSLNKKLTVEEKILGVVKIWTIVKYFYAYPYRCSVDWNNSLEKYLDLAQKTLTDKEYYTLIQEMMSVLNDSHSSTFHPSIVDFSNLFVVPIKFDWIENKVIVTAVDTSINTNIKVGDEILSIDGVAIPDILQNEQKKISSSNHQSLIATVINPGYFVGSQGSIMKLNIKNGHKIKVLELPRTTYFFQFLGIGDTRSLSKILPNNIGYLNLAFLANASELESKLRKLQNTNGLIIDLRNSYPTSDYGKFLSMLCTKPSLARLSSVPIIEASMADRKQIETSIYTIYPDTSFSYSKKIAVLVDKTMVSRPEDIAIDLKSFSNVVFVGEQTQGTDGEMTKIQLPGGGETSFTGQIVKFGNGDNFQGIGIIPDVEVKRTVKGVVENRDEILEKAIEILNKK